MMKLLILSDSHGSTANMIAAAEMVRPDYLIHLGDGWRDMEELCARFPDLPYAQVPGNCDFGHADEPRELILGLEGKTLLLCHGHTLGVKHGLLNAAYRAAEVKADALLFGHTHAPMIDERGGIWFFNPGSISAYPYPSYGVLELRDGKLLPSLFRL